MNFTEGHNYKTRNGHKLFCSLVETNGKALNPVVMVDQDGQLRLYNLQGKRAGWVWRGREILSGFLERSD